MRIATFCFLYLFTMNFISALNASELAFRQHDVNPDSKYSACAAFDVNHDGKTDIVCGGYWYEAPKWKRHKIRDVAMIRGRYDGYSHLPMDVNRDGWMDFVNCNYRSSAIYWIEHPGKSLGLWNKRIVDTPGPMETGRLVDVDGDGKLDILPNGVRFAAWWELIHKKADNGAVKPEWVRHDLPSEVGGHGVGFGDINGDGRGDVVGPRGWLEAPKNRRAERWIWRPEFQLHRDCSVPMFVHDVDSDGDADIIWARGHKTGIYWLEQSQDDNGDRVWSKHVIDTSWSQSHSPLLVDIDNDRQLELVTGKRYMAHDGKDPGAYDPLVIYWYKFDRELRTWKRHDISVGTRAGFGLDPKAIDMDKDGDLDLVVSGRSGLYLLENQMGDTKAVDSKPADSPKYSDHSNLLVFKTAQQEQLPVKSAADWGVRRAHILHGMQRAMGAFPNPSRRVPLEIRIVDEEKTNEYLRRKITFASEPGDRVPAYLFIPHEIEGKAPAMLCLHQTTKIGKGEPAGLGGRPTLDYAHELAERGYVCIAPDYPSFGDYDYDFEQDDYISGTMKAIWNNIRAVDVLETLPQVDHDQIGAIGHSLGGHNALFTAPFDLRITAVVTSCGFTAFHHYYNGKLNGWTSARYMPQIREVYKNDPDQVPFDFYEVIAAIAPRSVFINAPLHDGNFENQGVRNVVDAAGGVFELQSAKENLAAEYPNSGHDFPDDIRQKAYEWLDARLK